MNETQSLIDEIRSFDKDCFFDLGHPLVDRIAKSFVKATRFGAIQGVSREAYFIAIEGVGFDSSGGVLDITGAKKQRLPNFKGYNSSNSSMEGEKSLFVFIPIQA